MTEDVGCAGSPRRRWTSTEKLHIVEQSLALDASVAEVARRHQINPNLIYRWRQEAKSGALATTANEDARFALVGGAPAADQGRRMTAYEPAVEVVLRNGRVLRLPEGANVMQVAGLADALEGGRP